LPSDAEPIRQAVHGPAGAIRVNQLQLFQFTQPALLLSRRIGVLIVTFLGGQRQHRHQVGQHIRLVRGKLRVCAD